MHFKALFVCLFSLTALVLSTTAHAVILYAKGDGGSSSSFRQGPIGMALGVDPSTPRNGIAVNPHQRDTTIFKQGLMGSWYGCGQTKQSGFLNVIRLTLALVAKGEIAKVSPGGFLFMVLHQINGNGNGPYVCGIDKTGRGTKFSPLTVTRQVPGKSPTPNAVKTKRFPLQVAIPSDLKCLGQYEDMKNICMIRCQNKSFNGPYGACIPVQLVA